MDKLSSVGKKFLMLMLIAFSTSLIAQTLEVMYLNNPKSLRNFLNINIQCAAHYLSAASKLTDDLAKQLNMSKKEATDLMVKASHFHVGLSAFVEGNIQRRENLQPTDTEIEKLVSILTKKIVVVAGNYSPNSAEYQSTVKLCQSIQDNPQSYISKLDKL